MCETAAPRALVVDDEPEMRELIAEFLRGTRHFIVADSADAAGALAALEREPFDIIISDINMPGMKGFDLLKIAKEKYPAMKRLLITAYNVDDYLDLALNYDIGTIFVKTAPFNFVELSATIRTLLSNDIFGLDHYFGAAAERNRFIIKCARHLDNHARVIAGLIGDYKRGKRLEVVLVELLTNAIFYGVRGESPERKELWDVNCELSDIEAIVASVARDDEKYGISILDEGGRLKKSDVLYRMNRQITRDEKGLPLGLFDVHGRGLFIARRYIDRLIINIQPGKRTEVVIINYFHKIYSGNKPLYINEI